MKLEKLVVLKEKLQSSSEFREVISFFLDDIASQPGFLDLGQPVQHPFLVSVIEQVGQQCMTPPLHIAGLILTRLAEQQFIHGGCVVNGHPGTMIYFEDLQMGLFTLAITGKETNFARFMAKPLAYSVASSMN